VINRSSDPSINHSLKPSIEPSDPPLPPKRGKGGEPASEVQITEHEQPQEGEQTKATMTGNKNGTIQTSGKSKGSEKAPHSAKKSQKKKKQVPSLTEDRIRRFQALWNETTADVSWYARWEVTDKALEDALKVLCSSCYGQGIDAFKVFETALRYACTKSPFWGRPPEGGGLWTPIKLLRKTKGHVFSLYAEAITPEDEHPYPHLRQQGLAKVWSGPGEFDFDADLIANIQKSRSDANKPHDLGNCVGTILWMIDKNPALLRKCWQDAIALKEARTANETRRQMTLQDISMPVAEERESHPVEKVPGWVKFMRQANLDPDRAKQMYLEHEFEQQAERLGLGRSVHPHWGSAEKIFDDLSMVEKEDYIEFLKKLEPSDLTDVEAA